MTLVNLAGLARRRGDLSRAAALYAEGLALRWDQGDKVSVASCLRGLARTAVLARQYERACACSPRPRPCVRRSAPANRAGELERAEAGTGPLGEDAFAAAWAPGAVFRCLKRSPRP